MKTQFFLALLSVVLLACLSNAQKTPILVDVDFEAVVGVLIPADLPAATKTALENRYLAKTQANTDYWNERAKKHFTYTWYIVEWRQYYQEGFNQIPHTPESTWEIDLVGDPYIFVNGTLRFVAQNYTYHSVIVTNEESFNVSDYRVVAGESISEPFDIPIDPDYLLARTGYACIDEYEFPPGSVDTFNEVDYYDQYCEAEIQAEASCHQTQFPTENCIDAVTANMGIQHAEYWWTRRAWDENVAALYRTGGLNQNIVGADLAPMNERLATNRIEYRYIESSSCAIDEKCILATGWRRLLKFSAASVNNGLGPMHVGNVSQAFNENQEPTLFEDMLAHHMYEWSGCHQHYHFQFYAQYLLGQKAGNKLAWCLESILRVYNHEDVDIYSPYQKCEYQGITAGWADEYTAGIECQWIDITDTGSLTDTLSFEVNPEGFLCEGLPVLNGSNYEWEPTNLTTVINNLPIDRPKCNYTANYDTNNVGTTSIDIPASGSKMNEDCDREQIGELRDCGWTSLGHLYKCTPGATTQVTVSAPSTSTVFVARICESSRVLKQGSSCDATFALANAWVEGSKSISFKCPAARDSSETGGLFQIMYAPYGSYQADVTGITTNAVIDNSILNPPTSPVASVEPIVNIAAPWAVAGGMFLILVILIIVIVCRKKSSGGSSSSSAPAAKPKVEAEKPTKSAERESEAEESDEGESGDDKKGSDGSGDKEGSGDDKEGSDGSGDREGSGDDKEGSDGSGSGSGEGSGEGSGDDESGDDDDSE